MKISYKLIIAAAALSALFGCGTLSGSAQNKPAHRKIALQCYTFREFTLEETLEKVKDLGFDALEGTPAQKISASRPVKIAPGMSAEDKAALKALLAKYNLKFASYGVVQAKTEADVVKYCKFAKEFGIGAILTEAPVSTFKYWEKHGRAFGVKMYLHNHADTSQNQYFDPEVVRHFVSRCEFVKANPDNGHWSRSGIDSVEGFKILKGQIGSIHLKDQRKFGEPENNPVPYGEGGLRLKEVLAELDRQGYDGYFVIEYETDWSNPLPAVKKCVEFLRNN